MTKLGPVGLFHRGVSHTGMEALDSKPGAGGERQRKEIGEDGCKLRWRERSRARVTHAVQVSPPPPRAGRGATAGPENKNDMFGFMF